MVAGNSENRHIAQRVDKNAAVAELMESGALAQIAGEDDGVNRHCLHLPFKCCEHSRNLGAEVGIGKMKQGGHDSTGVSRGMGGVDNSSDGINTLIAPGTASK